jgi:predicted transglutaminase-like cysteine proteinase
MFNNITSIKLSFTKKPAKCLLQVYRDSSRFKRNAGRVLALVAVMAMAACAEVPNGQLAPQAAASRMPLGGSINPPMGAVLFCEANSAECASAAPTAPEEVQMTPQLWDELRSVQFAVDRDIIPDARADIAWHYPQGGTGNCVQYAMEKRRRLLSLGWPAAALQLATVITPQNNHHLVLVIDTSRGDWVLDNLNHDIARWQDLPYNWRERMQGASLRDWVSVAVRG